MNLIIAKLLIGLAIAAALSGAYYVHRLNLIRQGYEQSQAERREAENNAQRESIREISRLVSDNNRITAGYSNLLESISLVSTRLGDSTGRLREQRADFTRRLGGATPEGLRGYAEACERNLAGLREDTKRFGLEAAAGSAAAFTLKESLDSNTQLSPEKAK